MDNLKQALIGYFEQWPAQTDVEAQQLSLAISAMKEISQSQPVTPQVLPAVERWLMPAVDPKNNTEDYCRPLLNVLKTHYQELNWTVANKSYVGAQYTNNSGYTQLMGKPVRNREGVIFPHDSVAAGFLLIGPNVFYPPHHHKAHEFYGVLTGRAEWQKGSTPPRFESAGARIFHESMVVHATKTHDEPMLAVWIWTGELSRPIGQPADSWLTT